MKWIEVAPEDRPYLVKCAVSVLICWVLFVLSCLLVLSRHPDSDFTAPSEPVSQRSIKTEKFAFSAGGGRVSGRLPVRPFLGILVRSGR